MKMDCQNSPDGRENPRLFLARFGMTAGKWYIKKRKPFASEILFYIC
jgi:hypothetical protein